jgi:hypothetical protein
VCVVEPAVAVIVTVEAPAGVPVLLPPVEEPELPPHPAKPSVAKMTMPTEASNRNRNAGFASRVANFDPNKRAVANKHRSATMVAGSRGNAGH